MAPKGESVREREHVDESTPVLIEISGRREVGAGQAQAPHVEAFAGGGQQAGEGRERRVATPVLVGRDDGLGRAGSSGEAGLGEAAAGPCLSEERC